MDNVEKRLLQLENDRNCLMKFKAEMIQTFKERDPAKQTYKFIGEVTTSMALNMKDHQELKDGVKSIEKKLDDVIKNSPTKSESWAESVLKVIGYLVLGILITAFMWLIINDKLIP